MQFTLGFCIVNFSTSGFDLKPEVGCFSETGSSNNRNRKSKMCLTKREYNSVVQVISYFFDILIREGARDF